MKSLFKEYEDIFEDKEELENQKTGRPDFVYSPFALQDALGERSAKKTWLEYQKLRLQGIEAEELIYKLISKARDMLAISKGVDKEILNLKDYPYNKSKKDLKNWPIKNLTDFYNKTITAYYESRMGKEELETALEKIILSI